MKKAVLLLEDGFYLEGKSFGFKSEAIGEVVFNTSMTGYQEILTDPSYKGQIVCMTYPLIGNYGINSQDTESYRIWVEGFIIKEKSRIFSNWRAEKSLDEYLKENKIVGIEGVDTRSLVKHIREKGSMKGIISAIDFDKESLMKKLKEFPSIVGIDLVKEVTTQSIFEWNQVLEDEEEITLHKFCVVVIDCGVKYSILRNLKKYVEKVIVVPAFTPLSEILKLSPQGILFSNGPGDPEPVRYVIETARELIQRLRKKDLKIAVMGICLGHQILGLAFGGKTKKLKFGHHGGNHPVKDLRTGKIDITCQNHNFIVDPESIPDKNLVLTHINLYDNTPEGAVHKELPLFSVQFHPEAGPGPLDAKYIFKNFIRLIKDLHA